MAATKNPIKWPDQGRRIRAIREENPDSTLKKAAQQYKLSYSTYYYAHQGQRIGMEFLVSLFEADNISADYIMRGIGEPRIEKNILTPQEILDLAEELDSDQRQTAAIAILAGWDKYKLDSDQEEECNWPTQGRMLRMLLERLGYKKLTRFSEDYELNYSTLHYAYYGIRIGTDFLMDLSMSLGISFDYVLNNIGTMFLPDQIDEQEKYEVIDHALRLGQDERQKLAGNLLIN